MKCPFPLPTEFRTTSQFNRDIKKVPQKIKTQIALMVEQFGNGTPDEAFRPQKMTNTDLYRVKINGYRLLYSLEEKNGKIQGILRALLKRNNEYRELRNR